LEDSNSSGRRVSDQTYISIIDDDESFREAISSLVELLGYHVSAFASAEAFLASDAVDSTCCVITDIQMRGMTGMELHRRMLASGRSTPFIFVTALPDEATRVRALRDGAIGYLGKPMQEAGLVDCLDTAVHQR
jgi:FixJ family two-component response regulator